MSSDFRRPLAGAALALVLVGVVALTAVLFTGAATSAATVTVVTPRAGLVMDVDAKVQMRGVTVGRVSRIDYDAPGGARLTLAIAPDQLRNIPANVGVEITAPTVFGAKSVQLLAPARPAEARLHPDQILNNKNVEIEINNVFGDLTRVLAQIRPAELNAALGSISTALDGRGRQFGQSLSDLNGFFTQVRPALPALQDLLATTPGVLRVYADTSGPFLSTIANTTSISSTIVDQQRNLDAFLTSVIGLSTVGNTVLADNRVQLARALKLLVPTTSLTDEYNEVLTCSLKGFQDLADVNPYGDGTGLALTANFIFGTEPYYPATDKPKVAATGGSQCRVLPVGFNQKPKYVVTDTGADPTRAKRPTPQVNVPSLQQLLFGGIPDGSPR